MKKYTVLFLCFAIFASMLCSCNVDESNIDVKDINITIATEKAVYDTKTEVVKYIISNNADNLSADYAGSALEKYDNDTWTRVDVNCPVYADSFSIELNESKSLSLPVTDDKTIENGKYRVCVNLAVYETTGAIKNFDLGNGEEFKVHERKSDSKQDVTLYAEFTVE